MAIKIKGVIGSDVRGAEFADRISKLTGDIDFEIDSPGGSVFHGISIFNAIKNYDKGKCRMHVVGDCSSMAAYVMLAGDGPVDFEPNSIVVLHNPWSMAVGDYRAMQKEGSILEQMAELYAKEFVKKGLFEEKDIRQIMDEETWFIGAQKLKKLGNVLKDGNNNGNNDGNDEMSEEIKIAGCRERMEEAKATIRALKEENTDKIAALLKIPQIQAKAETTDNTTVITTKTEGENKMVANLQELKAQNPAVYTEAKGEGVQAESKRVASLMKFIDVDKQAVIDAIENGKTVSDDDFQSSILMARIKSDTIKGMQSENPEDLNPADETHAPEGEAEGGDKGGENDAKKKTEEAEANKLKDVLARMGISQE